MLLMHSGHGQHDLLRLHIRMCMGEGSQQLLMLFEKELKSTDLDDFQLQSIITEALACANNSQSNALVACKAVETLRSRVLSRTSFQVESTSTSTRLHITCLLLSWPGSQDEVGGTRLAPRVMWVQAGVQELDKLCSLIDAWGLGYKHDEGDAKIGAEDASCNSLLLWITQAAMHVALIAQGSDAWSDACQAYLCCMQIAQLACSHLACPNTGFHSSMQNLVALSASSAASILVQRCKTSKNISSHNLSLSAHFLKSLLLNPTSSHKSCIHDSSQQEERSVVSFPDMLLIIKELIQICEKMAVVDQGLYHSNHQLNSYPALHTDLRGDMQKYLSIMRFYVSTYQRDEGGQIQSLQALLECPGLKQQELLDLADLCLEEEAWRNVPMACAILGFLLRTALQSELVECTVTAQAVRTLYQLSRSEAIKVKVLEKALCILERRRGMSIESENSDRRVEERSDFSIAEVQWLSYECHNQAVTLKAEGEKLKGSCSSEREAMIAAYLDLSSKFDQYLNEVGTYGLQNQESVFSKSDYVQRLTKVMEPCTVYKHSLRRELGLLTREAYFREVHFTLEFGRKLRLEHVLEGHAGCVNRLAWNDVGTKLASGSDDKKILLWSFPDSKRPPLIVSTQHRANIFGVQFLPCCNDTKLVSVAMDHTVQLHELDREEVEAWRSTSSGIDYTNPSRGQLGRTATQTASKSYYCHTNRVKDVRIEPMNPHNFWSAGEDGMVRQFDTRIQTAIGFEAPNVLLSVVDKKGEAVELKSLDICKGNPNLLAVGCGDPLVRVYDRRMLSPVSPPSRSLGDGIGKPIAAVAPAHLICASSGQTRFSTAHSTYVNFSSRGDRLVCTYNGDHAYTFDMTSAISNQSPSACLRPPCTTNAFKKEAATKLRHLKRGLLYDIACSGSTSVLPLSRVVESPGRSNALQGDGYNGSTRSSNTSTSYHHLPEAAERARRLGNRAIFDEDWPAAVQALNEAVQLAPWCLGLYAKRAEAYLGRGWRGDALYALQDCEAALCEDQRSSAGAHLRRIKALKALNQLQCAKKAVDLYSHLFHERIHAEEFLKLRESLEHSLRQREKYREQWLKQKMENLRRKREAVNSMNEGRSTPRPPAAASASPASSPPVGTSHATQADIHSFLASAAAARSTVFEHEARLQASQSTSSALGVDVTLGDVVTTSEAEHGQQEFGPEASSVTTAPVFGTDEARSAWDEDSGGEDDIRNDVWEDGGDSDEDDPDREVLLRYYHDLIASHLQTSAPGSSATGSSTMADSTAGLYLALHGAVLQRFIGHCNMNTDIKESVFVGRGDKVVACGSDDGRVYLYCSETGQLLSTLKADEDVVNCVQPHPQCAVLATSGIESVVRLWSPDLQQEEQDAEDISEVIASNQTRSQVGPSRLRAAHLRALADSPHLYNLLLSQLYGNTDDSSEEGGQERADVSCRVN
ncbi:hypothetical protein CEUSTIGMA_g4957.t1 [Chlamydomonas eustigma]|uniref:Uncharacterized protein n=1 Tax=Chlamydomonas eustigma TaxID=1157962 RepID=A0A250X360_9CHLO|nr:hypothetical protein CEUSTIGMA_g4957.t1 [Chlamydomonas eustigma]|eukprot:GAX77513.1 hypothetical protein CEUSTIGMA_g4957.t1 [Chlamydomonas eustigma]